MEISITYCGMWNFEPEAASLADELKKDFNVDAELIRASGGVFDVLVDGKLVYSKKKEGRFPDEGEVSGILKGQWTASLPFAVSGGDLPRLGAK